MKLPYILLFSLASVGMASTIEIPVKNTPEFRKIAARGTYTTFILPFRGSLEKLQTISRTSFKDGKVSIKFNDNELNKHLFPLAGLIGLSCVSVKPESLAVISITRVEIADFVSGNRYTLADVTGDSNRGSFNMYYFSNMSGTAIGSCKTSTGFDFKVNLNLKKGFNAVTQIMNRDNKTVSLANSTKPVELSLRPY